MDATGGQIGAERAGLLAQRREARCPECGRAASADERYRKTGFWADPARWMPAVLLCVLVGFQFAAPLVLPGSVRTKPIPSTPLVSSGVHHEGYPAWFDRAVTWDEMARAAAGSSPEVELIAPFVQQLTQSGHAISWVGLDPAAKITLSHGFVVEDDRIHFTPKTSWSHGLVDRWLTCNLYEGAQGVPTSFSWRFAVIPLSGNTLGFVSLFISPESLAFTFVQVALGVVLVRCFARPWRKGHRRNLLRSPWVWLTMLITITLAALPTDLGRDVRRLGSSNTTRYSFSPIQTSNLTVERLRTLAIGTQPEKAIARAIYDERMRYTKGGAVRPFDTNHGQAIASITARMKTPASETSIDFGWPTTVATVSVREKSTPEGAAPTAGRFRLEYISRYGFKFQTNWGAWPGRSTGFQVHFSGVASVLVVLVSTWWLLRTLLQSRMVFRGRKRAAAGQCVGCGYDLKGLRGQLAATR